MLRQAGFDQMEWYGSLAAGKPTPDDSGWSWSPGHPGARRRRGRLARLARAMKLHLQTRASWSIFAARMKSLRVRPHGGVRPGREGGPSPLELHVWVVTFRLGQQRDPRDEAERAAEVLKP